jgi:hypothetical protein
MGLGTSPAAATTTPTVLQAAEPVPGSLFVANEGAYGAGNGGSGPGSITVYRPGASGNAVPEVVITKGIDEPSDLAFDASGDLWVTNNGESADDDYSVAEYTKAALASASPTPALSAYFWAEGLAFDSSGNLWLTSTTDVEEFGAPELPKSGHYFPGPKAEIVLSLDDDVCAPAFDHAGDMWSAGSGDTGDYTTLVEFTKAQLAKSGEPTAKVVITSGDLDYSCQPAFDAAGTCGSVTPSSRESAQSSSSTRRSSSDLGRNSLAPP